MKTTLLLLFIFFNANYIWAQTFFKRYSSLNVGPITQTQDGNLFFAGGNGLTKTDILGNFIFSRTYQGFPLSSVNSIIPSENNGAYLSLSYNSLYNKESILMRIDSLGNPLWTKKYYLSNKTSLSGMIKLHDGNILISAIDSISAVLLKVDTVGNVIWTKHYYGSVNQFYNISPPIELSDNSIVFCSGILGVIFVMMPPFPDPIQTYGEIVGVVKTDSFGNLIWSKGFYFTNTPYSDQGISLFGTNIFSSINSKLYVSFGKQYNGSWSGSTYSIACLDSLGNFEFSKIGCYIPPKVISSNSDSSLNILFPGGNTSEIYFPITSFFKRVSQNLDVLSQIRYNPFNYSNYTLRLNDFIQLPDKRILFTGGLADGIYSFQNSSSLLATDSLGFENCISVIEGSYFSTPDTNYTTQNLILNTDSGIFFDNIIITTLSDTTDICNCDNNPIAGFYYTFLDSIVNFIDTSSLATFYNWSFGDNNYSTLQSPTHSYSDTGTYQVSLTVRNNCGIDNITIPITITDSLTSVKPFEMLSEKTIIYPNPTCNYLNIKTNIKFSNIIITEATGQVVGNFPFSSKINIGYLKSGFYFLKLFGSSKSEIKSFTKIN